MGFRKRREYILFLALPFLPLANALSLANFQEITSSNIPLACQLAYDAQIPNCQVSDFREGCSRSCEEALVSVANFVSLACVGISASSTTLLGIVQRGEILQALCTSSSQTTTPMMETTMTSTQQVTSQASTTVMTTSSTPLVVTTTKRMTTTPSALPISSTTSSPVFTTSKTLITHSITASTTQSASDSVDVGGVGTSLKPSSTSTSIKPSTSKTSSSQTQSNQNGGAGDPFDFVSNDSGAGSLSGSSTMTSLVVVTLTALFLVW